MERKTHASADKDYLDVLQDVRDHGLYPLHMPGHKRHTRFGTALPFGLDVTEIDGTWDLHHPDALLKERLDAVARFVGASCTFYTVQGSTGGNLAGMYTLCPPGSDVLLSRASHQSLYHGVELLQLNPIYLMPDLRVPGIPGPIRPAQVEAALKKNPTIKTVLITSPTFEGQRCDIRSIAAICHAYGASLLVDQAHGAHLRYLTGIGPNYSDAVADGADIVIESLHKTLPALTPAALVHASSRVDQTELARALSIFETSSPSHILLASIDHCMCLLEREGVSLHQKMWQAWQSAALPLRNLKALEWMQFSDKSSLPSDPFRVVISTARASLSGPELANLLRQRGFEVEMAHAEHVLFILTIGDDPAIFPSLAQALSDIDKTLTVCPAKRPVASLPPLPEKVLSIADARRSHKIMQPLSQTAGGIAAESLWTYPPGIPLLVPGERIRQETLEALEGMASRHVKLRTEREPGGGTYEELSLCVLEEEPSTK